MLFRMFCVSSVSALVLTACATPQENPYYKYSSKYEGNEAVTTVASLPDTQIQAAPVAYEIAHGAQTQTTYQTAPQQIVSNGVTYTRVDHDCLSDTSVECNPVLVMTEQSVPIISEAYVSPTDTQFVEISDEGTPGYQVLESQSIEYDYSENIVSADAATVSGYSETRIVGGASGDLHYVSQGDTVYSIARKLCVGIDDIASLNNLGNDYAINIGDMLSLPAQRC